MESSLTCSALQVKVSLDGLTEDLSNLSNVGDCVARVEHLLKELKSLEEKAQVSPSSPSGHLSSSAELLIWVIFFFFSSAGHAGEGPAPRPAWRAADPEQPLCCGLHPAQVCGAAEGLRRLQQRRQEEDGCPVQVSGFTRRHRQGEGTPWWSRPVCFIFTRIDVDSIGSHLVESRDSLFFKKNFCLVN